MLSLAPFKYRNILSVNGGPIEKLLWSQIQISKDLYGIEASSKLRADLRPANLFENKLYGNPDGTGCDISKSTACYKAISESLERWAYYDYCIASTNEFYGFEIDNSTNGLAAFPGLTSRCARNISRFEALERWALVEWWLGKLSAKQSIFHEINYIEIPIPKVGVVVISWVGLPTFKKYTAYGFAAEKTGARAFLKSQVELYRNLFVLERYFKNPDIINISELNIQEQRLLWFAQEVGHQNFLENVRRTVSTTFSNTTPVCVLDKEVVGPWSQYATVWRYLFNSSRPHNEIDDVNFFFF